MENTEQQLQTRALSWPEQARAITVADQQTYDQAAEMLKGVADLTKQIKDHYAPLRTAAWETHRKICASEKGLLTPVEGADRILRNSIAAFDQEQERIRIAAERRAREDAIRRERERLAEEARVREERRRKDEEERLAVAADAESFGASEEEINHILEPEPADEEYVLPPQIIIPKVQTYQKAAGISTRQTWHAEVTSIRVLAHAIGTGSAAPNLILPNMAALNGLARSLKGAMNVPGVKAASETTTVRTG